MKWVLINIVVETVGYTKQAIYDKKKKGIWLQGIHWIKLPDGHLAFNLEAIQLWMEGKTA